MAEELIPSTSSSTNIVSLKEFSQIESEIKETEHLKAVGLSDEEIKLYNEHKRGTEFLSSIHKNAERSALQHTIANILNKIQHLDDSTSNGIQSKDIENVADKRKYSIDPEFQIKIAQQNNFVPMDHPINHLDDLEEDLFGHMDVDNLPSATKRRKMLRRMERKLLRDVIIPEPDILRNIDRKCKSPEPTHTFNDFIKYDQIRSSKIQERGYITQNPNSKWDIRDMKDYEKNRIKPSSSESVKTESNESQKFVGCKPQTLYTIKDNKIVRLESKPNINSKDIEKYGTVEIKLPINKAEERLLEGSRLSLEDIRNIPRFENYEPGEPTKVLYLKNLSNHIADEDLKKLFQAYDQKISVSLMTGRMRGQAFVTFTDAENAVKALNEKNGTIIKGKPVIIQYGKSKKCES